MSNLNKLKTVGWLLMMGASMSACSATTMTWKEEVLLHDGGKMVSTRFYNLGKRPAIESHERRALDETVTFTPPGSDKTITWKTDFLDEMPEPNSLNLLVLDIVNGVPYIAAYPAGCIAYNKWKRPNPPYVFFKYVDMEWKQIPLQVFPPRLSKTNVIVGRPPAKLLKPFYTVEQVNDQNFDIHTPEYKTILREALPETALCPGWSSQRYRSFKAPLSAKPAKK